MKTLAVLAAVSLGLVAPSVQSQPESARPSVSFLRGWICQLDTAAESDWRRILATLPGGATFGPPDSRDAALTSHIVTFHTPFLKGRAQWFSNSPIAGGSLRLESDIGPLFESVDGPREFLTSLGSAVPAPFDLDVLRSAFSTYQAAPSDGLMAGSYGRRVSRFSNTTRLEVDNLVAVDVQRNTLEAKISSRVRLCR